MRHCDKRTTDTAKHLGPFQAPYGAPYFYQDNGEMFEALQCAACGNTSDPPGTDGTFGRRNPLDAWTRTLLNRLMLFRTRSNSKDNPVTPSDSILMNTEFKSDLDSLLTLESRGAEMVSHLRTYLTQKCADHIGVKTDTGVRFHISASLHGRFLQFRIELFWGKSRVEGAIRAYVQPYFEEGFSSREEVLELDNPFTFDVLGKIKSSKDGVDTPDSFSPRFVAAVMRALREKGVSLRPSGYSTIGRS